MNRYYMLVLAFIWSFSSFAQVNITKKNQIGLSLGYNQGYFKDINFSPLNYSLKGMHGAFNYSRLNTKSKLNASLEFNYNSLPTEVAEFFTANLLHANLNLSYLFAMRETESRSIFIGPSVRSENMIINFEGFDSFTFLFVHSLGVDVSADFIISPKTSFRSTISLPLMHLLVRPPYNGFDKTIEMNADKPFKLITNGTLTTVNKYAAVALDLSYYYKINSRTDLSLTYALDFNKTFEKQGLIILKNRYSCATNYNF